MILVTPCNSVCTSWNKRRVLAHCRQNKQTCYIIYVKSLTGLWGGRDVRQTWSGGFKGSVEAHSRCHKGLREELGQGSMDRGKGDCIESRYRRRQDWGLQGPLSRLLIVQLCIALRQQQATQHESLVWRRYWKVLLTYSPQAQ